MKTELILVESIDMFRARHVVEVPKGCANHALEVVSKGNHEEFSQQFLGNKVVSHRVIDIEEYLKIFDEDNEYLKHMPVDKKTALIQEYNGEDDIERSEYFYDFERNK